MRILLTLILAIFVATPAFAAFQGPGSGAGGGFKGPGSANATTVAEAKNLPDDALVTLTGNIVSHFTGTDDKYMFRDATGEIKIDIDHKYFRGQDVTPKDTVRISGKIDKDFGEAVEIDVKQLEIVK